MLQSARVIGTWPMADMSLAAEAAAGAGDVLAGVVEGVDRPQPPNVAMMRLTQTIPIADWRMTAPSCLTLAASLPQIARQAPPDSVSQTRLTKLYIAGRRHSL